MNFISKLKNLIIIFILITISTPPSFGNKDSSIYSTYIDSFVYRIKHRDVAIGKIIKYNFPPLEKGSPYVMENIEAEKFFPKNFENEKLYGCTFKIGNKIELDKNFEFKINFYACNIDSLIIDLKLESIDFSLRLSSIKIGKDLLYYNYNGSFEKPLKYLEKHGLNKKKYKINEIVIYAFHQKGQRLIVNDLIIYLPIKVTAYSENSLINSIISKFPIVYNNQSNFCIGGATTPKISNLFETTDVDYLKYPIRRDYISKNDDKISKDQEYLNVSSSIRNIMVEYFETTENKKKYLLHQYDSIVKRSKSLDGFYQSLANFLYKLNDNHFRLDNDKDEPLENIQMPLYFQNIKDHIDVVAILDTTLLNKVNLGDRLIKINGKPVNEIINELDKRTAGSTIHTRNMKILQKLLYRAYNIFSDTLLLELNGLEKGKYTLKISPDQVLKNTRIKIPYNIKEKQKRYDFKLINNYAYLKVGVFHDKTLRPFIYSIIDSLMTSDALILDLRNNPGGDLSTLFLLSFFINSPSIYFTFYNVKGFHETILDQPDPYYYYSKPIVILFDSRTTCSCEFFICAMQKSHNDLITIGASKTAGSGQSIKYFYLPESKSFKGNLVYRTNIDYTATGEILDEIGGITPKVWTGFDSYLDLAPYNDKLLRMAVTYFDSKFGVAKTYNHKSNLLNIIITGSLITLLIIGLIIFLKFRKNKE
ncbi:MAG: hypothetical protein HOO91_11245 [Bacteroidales bacterium]|nr:hypothetical protein [Bacteroidales bacterium]